MLLIDPPYLFTQKKRLDLFKEAVAKERLCLQKNTFSKDPTKCAH